MPHTSVTLFLPAGQSQDGAYVGAGALVDPRLVVLTPPGPTTPLTTGQKVRAHLQVAGSVPKLVRGTAFSASAHPDLVFVQFAQAVPGLPVEKLTPGFATTTGSAVATLLRTYLAERDPDAVQTVTGANPTVQAGGKPWWCWISSNGPGCR
jgi:hypothetical protein